MCSSATNITSGGKQSATAVYPCSEHASNAGRQKRCRRRTQFFLKTFSRITRSTHLLRKSESIARYTCAWETRVARDVSSLPRPIGTPRHELLRNKRLKQAKKQNLFDVRFFFRFPPATSIDHPPPQKMNNSFMQKRWNETAYPKQSDGQSAKAFELTRSPTKG